MTIPFRGGKAEGVGQQQGRFWWVLTKATKRKIRETSREGERNRKSVSDSSLMQFPLINSEEMKRNLRWPWNSVAPVPTAFAGQVG